MARMATMRQGQPIQSRKGVALQSVRGRLGIRGRSRRLAMLHEGRAISPEGSNDSQGTAADCYQSRGTGPRSDLRMVHAGGGNKHCCATWEWNPLRPKLTRSAGGPLPILMDHDFLISWVGPCTGFYANPADEYTDEWGIGWKWFKFADSGSYTEMVRHPLADIVDPGGFHHARLHPRGPLHRRLPDDRRIMAKSTALWAAARARCWNCRGICGAWKK